MSELINGRTPEEIKDRTFECSKTYACKLCKYGDTECHLGVVLGDALALIERFEAAQPKWISVKERLPEENQKCLVFDKDREGEPIWSYTGIGGDPLYWMPLPEPPKEDVHDA